MTKGPQLPPDWKVAPDAPWVAEDPETGVSGLPRPGKCGLPVLLGYSVAVAAGIAIWIVALVVALDFIADQCGIGHQIWTCG